MSLSQTETVPSPLVLDAVVLVDPPARSVAVRLPENASGGQKMWWKTAHTALKAAVEDGWRNHSFVWASTPSVHQAVHVKPADFLMLTAHFPVGTDGFGELVGKPGLRAFVTVERNTGQFTRVSFRHKP